MNRIAAGTVSLALAVLPPLAAAPATAVPSSVAASGVGALMVPAFCGSSICGNPANAPLLLDTNLGGAGITRPVVSSVAEQGGYIARYGKSGLGGETAGGLAGIAITALGVLGWTLHNDGTATLPPSTSSANVTATVPSFYVQYGYGGTNVTKKQTTATISLTATAAGIPAGSTVTIDKAAMTIGANQYMIPGEVKIEYRCVGAASWSYGWGSGLGSATTSRVSTWTSAGLCTTAGLDSLRVVSSIDQTVGSTTITDSVTTTVPLGGVTDPTPKRWIQQTVTCDDANGNTQSITTTGTQTTGTTEWDMPAAMCPDGTTATGMDATLKTLGGPDTALGTLAVPGDFQETQKCDLAGGNCKLEWQPKSGFSEETAGSPKDNPQNWDCTYSGRVIAVEYCGIYPLPGPGIVPAPVEDPARPGNPKINPKLNPNPVVDPPPATGENCPSMSSVTLGSVLSGRVFFDAAACALAWAFVPEPTTLTESARMLQTTLNTTAPYVAIDGGVTRLNGLMTAVDNMGGAGGCAGPTLDFHGVTVKPVDLCDPPLSTAARWVKLAISCLLVGFTITRIVEIMASAFNIRVPWSSAPVYVQDTLPGL